MKSGVSVQTNLAEGLPPIRGDRVELQQVILNLILNALEAMSEMGGGPRELVIGSRKTEVGDDVLVTIRNSGPGLIPETLEHLFKAFYTTKAERLGARAFNLPFDHRGARRKIIRERQCAPWRRLSIHAACPSRHGVRH